jgi:hypothetical protein
LEVELRPQFLLRDDDGALVRKHWRESIKRALSLPAPLGEDLCWLKSA